MGNRYFLTVICPKCGETEKDVYYAPTCGFTEWNCPKCKKKVDLEEYSGISYEEASNRKQLSLMIKRLQRQTPPGYTYAGTPAVGHWNKIIFDKPHWTTGKLAKFLGVSVSTVQRYVDKGKIRAKTNLFTGRRTIPQSAVDEFVAGVMAKNGKRRLEK
jgi:excisionase family DNA binding protein